MDSEDTIPSEKMRLTATFGSIRSATKSQEVDIEPLYDVLATYKYNYQKIVEYILEKQQSKEPLTVIQNCSRTGHLLNRLENEPEIQRLIGIESSLPMVERASTRTGAILIHSLPEYAQIYSQSDVSVLLPHGLDELSFKQFSELCGSVYGSLDSDGIFIAQYSNKNLRSDESYTEEIYECDGYDVIERSIEYFESDSKSTVRSHFTLTNESGDSQQCVTEYTRYYHTKDQLEDALYSAGFSYVGFTTNPDFANEQHPVIIARK